MEIPSELTTTTCDHCERDIPSSNIDLHYAHCYRNLQRCSICGDMVPKKHADEHYNEVHAAVDCSLCNETVPREDWVVHKGETCPQRITSCDYCEFPLPAVDLLKHQEICGNRTEYCHTCNKYIRLRERVDHEFRFHNEGHSNSTAEPSRGTRTSEGEADHRRPARDSSPRKMLLTIAITGIAVILGSFFLQRRAETQNQQ